jgi:hypothetical protein
MNLMRFILLFVWVLGCFSGRLRDPKSTMCVEVTKTFSYSLQKCDGLPAQQFHLEGKQGKLLRHPESGSCIPTTKDTLFDKLNKCSASKSYKKMSVKVNGTTVTQADNADVCLITAAGRLGFIECVESPKKYAIMMLE